MTQIFNNNFTVLMAVYYKDDSNLFDLALSSVFENTVQPESTILVVDGPVGDLIKNVIKKYQQLHKQKFVVCWLNKNLGLANALNKGLDLVTTEFVARADADDINLVDRFEKQCEYIDKGYDIIGTSIAEIDKSGILLSVRNPPQSHDEIIKFLKHRSPFNHMTVFFRTDLAKSCGGYPELDLREDYGLWIRMIKLGAKCINLSENLVLATTGDDFYKRRGGLRSVVAEYKLQCFFVRIGHKKMINGVFSFIAKAPILIMPFGLRKLIYKFFLRS